MKRGQTVEIVANHPARGQSSIDHLVGQEKKIEYVHRDDGRETGEITVDDDGPIILNREEYQLK